MTNKARVFISYKTGPDTGLTFHANMVRRDLAKAGYDVWWDAESLQAGMEWNEQIFKEIPERDVLVLLLAGETANSDWVRREVDIAKATRAAVLPVKIRGDFDLQPALQKFDLTNIQALPLLTGTDEEFTKLREGIDQLHEGNRRSRRKFLDSLGDKPGKVHEPAEKQLHTFKLEDSATRIHIAAGNFMDMKGFDALVNTENNYMQMARIFESKSISSLLRYYGSEIDAAGRIVEDTVQKELDKKLEGPRPVGKGTVIVTSAGHPDSRLRHKDKMGARYILHAAAVSVQGDGSKMALEPIRDAWTIKDIVLSVLTAAREINEDKLKSIYIPMFGAGRGGLSVDDVAMPIVRGVREYLIDQPKQCLKHIYLGVYGVEDVKPLEEALKKEFTEVPPTAEDASTSQKV